MPLVCQPLRFQAIFTWHVAPYLCPPTRLAAQRVCRAWRAWIAAVPPARAAAERRRPSAAEMDEVVGRLRALNLPWSDPTETYLRESLAQIACLAPGGEDLDALVHHLERLYHRAVLVPKTNIGTLDTTRVIERLTQARLSRFHSTGVAAIQQANGSLDALLHPQQSTRRPQMIVHLDPACVDVHDARAVIEHVRGRLLTTTLGTFVRERGELLERAALAPRLLRMLAVAAPAAAGGPPVVLRLPLHMPGAGPAGAGRAAGRRRLAQPVDRPADGGRALAPRRAGAAGVGRGPRLGGAVRGLDAGGARRRRGAALVHAAAGAGRADAGVVAVGGGRVLRRELRAARRAAPADADALERRGHPALD